MCKSQSSCSQYLGLDVCRECVPMSFYSKLMCDSTVVHGNASAKDNLCSGDTDHFPAACGENVFVSFEPPALNNFARM